MKKNILMFGFVFFTTTVFGAQIDQATPIDQPTPEVIIAQAIDVMAEIKTYAVVTELLTIQDFGALSDAKKNLFIQKHFKTEEDSVEFDVIKNAIAEVDDVLAVLEFIKVNLESIPEEHAIIGSPREGTIIDELLGEVNVHLELFGNMRRAIRTDR